MNWKDEIQEIEKKSYIVAKITKIKQYILNRNYLINSYCFLRSYMSPSIE